MDTDKSLLLAMGKSTVHSNHECEIVGILAAFKMIVDFAHEKYDRFRIFTDNKGTIL